MIKLHRRLLWWGVAAVAGLCTACVGTSSSDEADRSGIPSSRDGGAAIHRGPIVLVTFANLRFDLLAVGSENTDELQWLPHLDALYDGLGEARGWHGVAASSSPLPSLASLIYGVDPWRHGVLSHLMPPRSPGLPSLGSALAEVGYSATAHVPLREGWARFGVFDGMQEVVDFGDGSAAVDELATLDGSRRFVWVHVPVANPPLLDHRHLVPRLADRPGLEPLGFAELLPYADPSRPMPSTLVDHAQELYRQEAAWGDQLLGAMLDAIVKSGHADETLLVVTALHGNELGEHGQALFAQNLGRESVEVPLIVRLPPSSNRRLAEHRPWVAMPRIWSTLVEAAGGTVSPAHLPSLFRPSTLPILSSLFGQGPWHRFAILEALSDDRAIQLQWSVQYADAEPDLYRIQADEASRKGRDHRAGRLLRARLARSLASSLPLTGLDPSAPPELRLESWLATGGVESVDDTATTERLAAVLRHRFLRFSDRERPLNEELSRRRLEMGEK